MDEPVFDCANPVQVENTQKIANNNFILTQYSPSKIGFSYTYMKTKPVRQTHSFIISKNDIPLTYTFTP